MPRTRRLLVDDGYYHIIQRGNNRRALFHRPKDFDLYLALLRTRLKRTPCIAVHHYCLMPNHIHLLLRLHTAADFPRLMHWLNLTYTHYYRKTYDYIGHLFQGRYKALPIRSDSYLLECGRYIERNPLRAGLADHPGKYPWSSYRFYAESRPDPLLHASPAYQMPGEPPAACRARYQAYVLQPRPYEELVDQQLLGRVPRSTPAEPAAA